MSEDLFARKVRGRVVTVYCRSCQAAIHVDGTEGDEAIVKASEELPTMPSTGPDPSEVESEKHESVGAADIGARVSAPPPLPKRKQGPRAELREVIDEAPVWVVSGKDDLDHEFSDAQMRSALIRGQFDGSAIAWREGMTDWLPVSSIPELQPFLKGLGPSAAAPPRPSRFGTQKAASPFVSKSPTLRPPSIETLEPSSIVVLKDEGAAALPPSSAHAALEALSEVELAESGLSLPPSSATAAEEALAETLADDEVMSVHNPPILRGNDDIAVETLSDEEVKSVQHPAFPRLDDARPSPPEATKAVPATPSPVARPLIGIAADKTDVRGSDPFVLVDLEGGAPRRPLDGLILPDDSGPVSSVPPMRGTSRAGVWLAALALLGIGGGWLLLGGRPQSTSERSATLERDRAPSTPKESLSMAEEPTLPRAEVETPEQEVAPASKQGAKAVTDKSRAAARNLEDSSGEGRPQGTRRPKPRSESLVDAASPELKPDTERPALEQPDPAPRKPVATPETPPEPAEEAASPPAEAKPEPPPFDKAAAQSALAAAAALAGACRRGSAPPGTTSVTVIIAPSGRVTSASVSGPPYAGTETGGCVAQRMKGLRVPAFSGTHQTVQKTVVVR